MVLMEGRGDGTLEWSWLIMGVEGVVVVVEVDVGICRKGDGMGGWLGEFRDLIHA